VSSFAERHRDRLRDRARERARARAPEGPLRAYLSVPPPPRTTPLAQAPLLAVDFETTGLDARTAQIVSVGLVPIDGRTIGLAGARRLIVRPEGEVGQSAVVHGLTDDIVEAGVPLAEAVEVLLAELAGRLMVAHHSVIEIDFLAAACRRLYGQAPALRSIDTLVLQHRVFRASGPPGSEPPAGSLRLWAARERYGLPTYQAHDALVDALACAELYLAQSAELGAGRDLEVRQVMSRYG